MALAMLSQLKAFLKSPISLAECLRKYFTAQSETVPFMRIPTDVFIDEIFTYLMIEDILSLRRTNKGFYLLTHEPIIWKRFLERMNFPIPPIRPSFRYTLSQTEYEVEQLVAQAITADDNWRRNNPFIYDRLAFEKYNRVTDMCILPGGKFLVSSCQTADKSQFWLVVYALDHPHGPRSLCRIPTYSEAYRLEAKFMDLFPGEEGLVISYVRRVFREPHKLPAGAKPADFSHHYPVDVPGGFAYEVVTVYTSLTVLEFMSSPDFDQSSNDYQSVLSLMPPPFKELSKFTSLIEVHHLSLFTAADGIMLLSLQRGPTEIVFFNLQNFEEWSTLSFADHPYFAGCPHRIRAYRVYPGQSNMVVVQSVTVAPGHIETDHIISLFPLPNDLGVHRVHCKGGSDRFTLHRKAVAKFHISDYGLPGRSPVADHPRLRHHAVGPPPPISIYAEMLSPRGVEHIGLYPAQMVDQATGVCTYEYKHEGYQMSSHCSNGGPNGARLFVCPGANRALVGLVDGDDRTDSPKLLALRRYVHPEHGTISYEPDPEAKTFPGDGDVLRKGRLPVPKCGIYRTIDTGDSLEEVNRLGGAKAICFDESTGRICIAPDKGGILLLNGSRVIIPGERFAKWKQENTHLYPEPV